MWILLTLLYSIYIYMSPSPTTSLAINSVTFPPGSSVEEAVTLTLRKINLSHWSWLWSGTVPLDLSGHVGVSITQGRCLDGTMPAVCRPSLEGWREGSMRRKRRGR